MTRRAAQGSGLAIPSTYDRARGGSSAKPDRERHHPNRAGPHRHNFEAHPPVKPGRQQPVHAAAGSDGLNVSQRLCSPCHGARRAADPER